MLDIDYLYCYYRLQYKKALMESIRQDLLREPVVGVNR